MTIFPVKANLIVEEEAWVALYVKSSLQSVDNTPKDNNVELVSLSANTDQFKIHISHSRPATRGLRINVKRFAKNTQKHDV